MEKVQTIIYGFKVLVYIAIAGYLIPQFNINALASVEPDMPNADDIKAMVNSLKIVIDMYLLILLVSAAVLEIIQNLISFVQNLKKPKNP